MWSELSEHTSWITSILTIASCFMIFFYNFNNIWYSIWKSNIMLRMQVTSSSWTWCSHQWRSTASKLSEWFHLNITTTNFKCILLYFTSSLVIFDVHIDYLDANVNHQVQHQLVIPLILDANQFLVAPTSEY